jgi:hypothetical protein
MPASERPPIALLSDTAGHASGAAPGAGRWATSVRWGLPLRRTEVVVDRAAVSQASRKQPAARFTGYLRQAIRHTVANDGHEGILQEPIWRKALAASLDKYQQASGSGELESS